MRLKDQQADPRWRAPVHEWHTGHHAGRQAAGTLQYLRLSAAWIQGFAHGICEAIGPIPGYHLSGVWHPEDHTLRTELVPDRRRNHGSDG